MTAALIAREPIDASETGASRLSAHGGFRRSPSCSKIPSVAERRSFFRDGSVRLGPTLYQPVRNR